MASGKDEYARDVNGHAYYEFHSNIIVGIWSLLRSRPRRHRGILQERSRSLLLGVLQFVHDF